MTEEIWGRAGGPDQTRVEIARGITMPNPAKVDVFGWRGLDVHLICPFTDGRFECEELTVKRRPGGPDITGELLRSMPIARWMREGIAISAAYPEDMEELAKQGPTDEVLRWVASLYRVAYASGVPPKQHVASEFGVAPATAGRWIARAREAGWLEPAKGPGKAGV